MNERSLPLNSLLQREKDNSDSFIDLDRLAAAVLRRARIVMLSVALFIMLGIAYLVFATPIYTSQTQILLDENLSRYAEEEQASAQSRQQADTQISSAVEILKSGKMALRVVDEADLAENDMILNPPQSPVATAKSWLKSMVGLFDMSTPASEAAILSGKRQKAAALIQQSITVERVSRSAVVALSYRSPDPQLAAKVTNAYAEAFLTDELNANFDATEKASVWLQERLSDLGQRAQAASLDVERFKTENGLTSARGQLMSEQQLADLNSQLIIAQADAATAGARYRQFKSITDQGPEGAVKNAVVSSQQTDNSVIQELRGRYLTIEKREQEITQNFGADHPQAVALRAEKTDVAGRIFRELEQLTASYSNEFEVARSREQSLRDSIDGVAGRNSEANRSLVRLSELEQKATALKTLYESYLSRYELATQQQSFPIAKARVISEAGVPVSPSAPKRTMVLALSAVLGLMLGGVLGFFQEMQERFFRLESDVRNVLGQKSLGYLPLIGTKPKKVYSLPPLPFLKNRAALEPKPDRDALNRVMRTVLDAPRSAFTETLRNTKLATDIILQGRTSRVIGVVSSIPGEGKSTVAANFAVLLAASGKRTLLIDGDLRNPSLSRLLKPSPKIGLVEVVLGEVPWTNAVKIDQETKLHILPVAARASSKHLHHTNELLASPGMTTLIDNVRQSFDYVIVDLAPLGPVVDAKAFSPHADGFIFVVEWGKTPTRLVSDILDAETQISSKILGVILNKTDMTELGRYGDFGGSETMRHNYAKYYVEQTAVAP
ncbi:polysaccharide biosynthesis tyrosine autokinase [Agrobacterium sp. a22-2]|uniref:polysaccharide biosynthesis tyrosine autokinase n=1 Tax=Agrobacterium sp. a22-2 TaxID=2283840 RepID=UPI0014480476|nr:polysaccharide biosynthesis tyrosine autokinase [Agrobacterium sp. a22-2]NKN37289.1 polysaccharide biosynthesis tyrosine autokinase [Agrobacterium sp. a22-2]